MFNITLGRPRGALTGAPMFTGEVYMQARAEELGSTQLNCYDVHFHSGGRTVWHTHDADQMIVIMSGEGIVANDDRELAVQAGDVVLVPAGERHWHGATHDSEMSHFTVMVPSGSTQVLEPVAP
jgi:quercetin dioxygenase-like cupin family protein